MFNAVREPEDSNDSFESSADSAESRKRSRSSESTSDEENQPPTKIKNHSTFSLFDHSSSFSLGLPNGQSTPHANYTYPFAHPPLSQNNPTFSNTFPIYQPPIYNQPPYSHYQFGTQSPWVFSPPFLPPASQPMSSFDSGVLADQTLGFTSESNSGHDIVLPTDPKEKPFVQVSGRLALLNYNQKYNITTDEVKRRICSPENLNLSMLGGVLRKAKNKGGGKKLAKELEAVGINLALNRRKSLPPSSFTALCETEALSLAEDFRKALVKHWDVPGFLNEIADTIGNQRSIRAVQIQKILNEWCQNMDLNQSINVIVELLALLLGCACEVLERDCSLLEMGLADPRVFVNRLGLPKKLQNNLREFNLVTHNFGVKAVLAVFSTMSDLGSKTTAEDSGEDVD